MRSDLKSRTKLGTYYSMDWNENEMPQYIAYFHFSDIYRPYSAWHVSFAYTAS